MRRARTDDQKQARKDALLDAAGRLLAAHPFTVVSVFEIAEAAGLAKGTVYLYAPTKEALYLDLLEREIARWFDALDGRLAGLHGGAPDEVRPAIVRAVLDGFAAAPLLPRLLALLHVVLEHNADAETVRRFKHFLRARTLSTAVLLHDALPSLGPNGGLRFLLRLHALTLGFQQMADPAPVVATVLEDPDLALFRLDFSSALASTLDVLLREQG